MSYSYTKRKALGMLLGFSMAAAGCPSGTHGSVTDGDGDGVPDSEDNCPARSNGDQADVDGDGIGDVCDPDHPLVALVPLDGWWVVARADLAQDLRWGSGEMVTDVAGDEAQLAVTLADGRQPSLTLARGADGALVGQWRDSVGASSTQTVTFAQADTSVALLSGTFADGQMLQLHRVVHFGQQQVGVWHTADGDLTALLALDFGWSGNQALLSILDPDGGWPEDGRYSGTVDSADDPRIQGTGLTALSFQQGQRMYVCRYEWALDIEQCEVLEAAPQPSPLNGLWLERFQTYQQDLPQWYAAVVVQHEQVLYVHHRDEAFLDSLLTRSIRPETVDGTSFIDTSQGGSVSSNWHGYMASSNTRIVGRYDGWEEYYHSLQRTVEPPAGWLTGDASSLSADWFDAPSGIPEPILGSAVIVQDGSRLEITDHSSDGATYRVEATWNGYQYLGFWWDEAAPGQTSPWRGQLLANSWYLHGTWEKGEYSFSLVPFGTMQEAADPPVDVVVASPDPFKSELAYIHDSASGNSVTLKRDQDRLSGMHVVLANGDVYRVAFDERYRPVQMEGPGDWDVTTLVWSTDSQTVEIIADVGGSVTTETLSVDYSDQAIVARLDQYEVDTGTDMTPLRTWILDNPGRAARILRGEEPPPSMELTSLDGALVKHGDWNQLEGILIGNLGAGITFAGALAAMLMLSATTPLVVAVLVTAVYFGAAIMFGYFIVKLIAWFMDWYCDPCRITCFINCPP